MSIDWGSLIGAGIGALGARQAAQQANKPTNTTTNQTSVQGPYAEGLIQPDIQAALDLQRQLMEQGPAHVGGHGSSPSYGWGAGAANSAGGGGGGGAAGIGGAAPSGSATGNKAWFASLPKAEQQRVNKMSAPQLKAYKASLAAGGGTPGGPAGGAGAAPPVNYSDPRAISAVVAQRGLATGSDPTTLAAQAAARNMLAGEGGADSGTGFQTYNPLADFLAQQSEGDVGNEQSMALLRQFMGEDGGFGGAGVSSGRSGGSGGRLTYGGDGGAPGAPGSPGYGPGGQYAGGAGNVPDTVGNNNSYFAQQVKALMGQGASDADVQAIIDRANADTQKGLASSLWGLDAQSQGAGRYGGDMYAALGTQARQGAAREMATNASSTRLAELANRRAMQEALLGQVNTRDLGAMQDATNRYGIDTNANATMSAANAGAGAAAASAARGQNLQALLAMQQGEQFNRNQLAGLGSQYSSDQINAMGQAQNLAGVGLAGLGAANSASGNMFGYDASRLAAQTQRGIANSQLNQQAAMFNAQQPQNMVNSYFDLLRGIGGMGGYSHTEGTNVIPGAGVNPNTAALMGGYAGYQNSRGTGGGG